MCTRLLLDHFLILVNNPKQPQNARNYLKSKIFGKKIAKVLKKLILFFLSNTVLLYGQSYQKQKEPGTSDQLLFRLQNKFRKIALLVICYLTKFDDII